MGFIALAEILLRPSTPSKKPNFYDFPLQFRPLFHHFFHHSSNYNLLLHQSYHVTSSGRSRGLPAYSYSSFQNTVTSTTGRHLERHKIPSHCGQKADTVLQRPPIYLHIERHRHIGKKAVSGGINPRHWPEYSAAASSRAPPMGSLSAFRAANIAPYRPERL